MLHTALALLGLIVTGFAALCLFLYLKQDSFLFVPQRTDQALAEHWRTHRVEILAGRQLIEGWWAENPAAASNAVVLYFGGNAEDVLRTAMTAEKIGARKRKRVPVADSTPTAAGLPRARIGRTNCESTIRDAKSTPPVPVRRRSRRAPVSRGRWPVFAQRH
jgi:hypothetical protein